MTSPNPSAYHARRRPSDGQCPSLRASSYSAAPKRSASTRSITRIRTMPRVTRTRSVVVSSIGPSALAHPQDRQECFLGDLDRAHPLHSLLALFLLLEELALPGDVPTVALGQHVLAERAHGFAGYHAHPDHGVHGYFVHLRLYHLAQRLRGKQA